MTHSGPFLYYLIVLLRLPLQSEEILLVFVIACSFCFIYIPNKQEGLRWHNYNLVTASGRCNCYNNRVF